VYLDLNHWINLTKAALGKGSSDYGLLLESLRRARAGGSIRLVLSTSFVEEFSAIKNPRQRNAIVGLIDELTDFEYLAGLADVFKLELQAFLNEKVGGLGMAWAPIPLVGTSMLHVFGKIGGLRVFDERTGADVTDEARNSTYRDDPDWFSKLERRAERELLAGPRDDEVERLRLIGYMPERPRQSHHKNLLIEQGFSNHLNQHWRKGRLLDVLAARHLNLELLDMLTMELMTRGISLDDVSALCSQNLELPLSMPASAVFVGLKTQYHRDPHHKWTDNDLHDIGALALAIPYCDIVFTDAAARNAAVTASLDKAMNTEMPRSPAELADLIDQIMV